MRQDLGLLLFRVLVSAAMMLGHGWGKLANFSTVSERFISFAGLGPKISLGLAVFGEFFCPILIIVGVCTRLACLPVMATMLVAWYMHGVAWGDPWGKQELAALYFVCFGLIALTGPGGYALCSDCKKKLF